MSARLLNPCLKLSTCVRRLTCAFRGHIGRWEAGKHVAILYFVTFFVILPTLCFRHRHSVYHVEQRTREEEIKYLQAENTQRFYEAFKHITAFSNLQSTHREERSALQDNVDVAITIITLSRNRHKFSSYEPNYLTQVVSKYLLLLHRKEALEKRYKVYICNIDPDPRTYIEFRNLTGLLAYFQRFPDRDKAIYVPDVFAKEKDDYVYCLNQTLATQAKHVLLVEDDALPLNDLFLVVNHVIDVYLNTNEEQGVKTERKLKKPPSFVKLYHPERLLGYWSPEFDRIPQLLAFGCLWGTILLVLYQRYLRWKSNIYFLWVLFSLYFILLAISIGRQNLLEWRRVSKHFYLYTPVASCCTQGILFPRTGGEEVVNFLAHRRCYKGFAKDMALDAFRHTTGSKAFMIQPNLFKHIGLFSSLRNSIVNPFALQ